MHLKVPGCGITSMIEKREGEKCRPPETDSFYPYSYVDMLFYYQFIHILQRALVVSSMCYNRVPCYGLNLTFAYALSRTTSFKVKKTL